MGMGHARGRERGARRSRRPIYYFDIVHDYPEIGGVAEFSQRLFRQLKRQYGRRLMSAREVVARLGGPDASMLYLDREKRAAELLAAADPDSIFFFPNFQSPIAKTDRHAGPRIVNVIHDVQFAHLPELFTADRRRWLHQTFAQTRDNADLIVFVSRTTQQQYIAQFGSPRRHTVIYNPVANGKARVAADFDEPFLLTAAHHFPTRILPACSRCLPACLSARPRSSFTSLVTAARNSSETSPCCPRRCVRGCAISAMSRARCSMGSIGAPVPSSRCRGLKASTWRLRKPPAMGHR
jgi:glycosyltransferase involved in cell wall biosynthesis